jgi:hypothetical protein
MSALDVVLSMRANPAAGCPEAGRDLMESAWGGVCESFFA